MELYLKQKVFSIGDKFTLFDSLGEARYTVQGEILTFGKKLHIYDLGGTEKAFIEQKVLSFKPRFFISQNGIQIAEVVREITFFRSEYSVIGPGWTVNGDFLAHEYSIEKGGMVIACVSKKWMTWGDTYEISIADPKDEMMALSVVLVIDANLAQQNSSRSAFN